jgi:hypothetical protein
VDGGLHQCILCTQVVSKKDVYPKLEDLPEEFRLRWDAHEAKRPAAIPTAVEVKATPTAAETETETATPTAASPRPSPPLRVPPADPHPGH